MKPAILLTAIMFIASSLSGLQAQDKIFKRDGEVIECKVLEVGSEEIKYSQHDDYKTRIQSLEEKIKLFNKSIKKLKMFKKKMSRF